ncbi:MAG: nucleotide pyrophosphohydrolase [Candidatus Babeliales bacterium]
MHDMTTTLENLKSLVKNFTCAREWEKFHSPKELCDALTVESAELQEIFLWTDKESSKEKLERKRQAVLDEAADVLYWLLQLAWQHNIDLSSALEQKMLKNEAKYPVVLAKGNTKKYTEL